MTGPLDLLPQALKAVAPHLTATDIQTWTAALASPMRSSGIVTEKRIAMFLGQSAEESGGFTELVEDLNYSVSRLCQVWPSRFPTAASAAPYARNPQKLANHVYANRMGNGNEASDDGWNFRGRGIFQVTGRSAYSVYATSLGKPILDVANSMEHPPGAAQSACWWWSNQGQSFLDLCDDWDIRGVTQRTNGGLTNLQARVTSCGIALAALANSRPPPPITVQAETSADALDDQYNPGV